MPSNVSRTLRQALSKLQDDRGLIDRQIAALRHALDATTRTAVGARPARRGTARAGPDGWLRRNGRR